MSRAWSVSLVGFAGLAMWLALGWPGAKVDQRRPEPVNGESPADDAKPTLATPLVRPKEDAAAPEPEEPPGEPQQAGPVAPAAPPGPAAWPQGDILAGDRGPVDEYRALYNREARDSAATDVEGAIRTAFGRSTRPDLLHSASCHRSVCKVLIRWSPERARDYILATRWLALGTAWPPGQPGFESRLALTAGSENDKDGARIVELYLKRQPPSAAKPQSQSH